MKNGALVRQRLDLPRFDRNRIGTEFDHDLARSRRLHKSRRALHGLFERLIRRQAGKHDVSLRADFGR